MKLQVTRNQFTTQSTVGELTVNEVFECFTLEDPVRPKKTAGVTAIPAGTYTVEITPSAKFKRDLPLLHDVPEFEGVRIHSGNVAADTEGCLLVGKTRAVDSIGQGRVAFQALFAKIKEAEQRGEAVTIEIVNAGTSPFMASAEGVPVVHTADGTVFRVTADPLRLRSAPDASGGGNIIARLPFGQLVTQSGTSDVAGWIQVTTELNGAQVEGFVSTSFLEAVPTGAATVAVPADQPETTSAGGLFRVKATKLNLRREPANLDDEAVIAALPQGLLVSKRSESNELFWWEVEALLHGQALRGFVHSGFLEADRGLPTSTGSASAPAPSMAGEVQCTERAFRLILSSEGLDQPGKWPGGDSGITIGIGYDLGFCTHDEFFTDWSPHISPDVMHRLAEAIGTQGESAKNMAPSFADITITRSVAEQVFTEQSLPTLKQKTAKAFPGVTELPPDAQGALVSLVYNRGSSMAKDPQDSKDRRREMREIRDAITRNDLSMAETLESIAASLESMKRLWVGQGLDGLLRRRDAEATLVRSSIA